MFARARHTCPAADLVLVRHRADRWPLHHRQAGELAGFFWGLAVANVMPAISLLPFRRRSCLLLARQSLVRWRERPAGFQWVKNQAHSGTRTASIKKSLCKTQN